MACFHSPPRFIAGFSFLSALAIALAVVPTSHAAVGISISGTVTDSAGAPLTGAWVVAQPSGIADFTRWNGRFELIDVPDGLCQIKASCLGYFTSTTTQISIHSGELSTVRIQLTPDPVQLREVKVSSRLPLPPSVENSQFVITCDDWKATGARSLEDALRQAPGLQVLTGDRMTRLSIRGSPARAVEINRDGVPLNDPATGEADLAAVRLDDLEAIAVEPSGAGGKVHLISRGTRFPDAGQNKRIDLATEYSSPGSLGGDAALDWRIAKIEASIGIGGDAREGDFKYQLDNGTVRRRYNNRQETASGSVQISQRNASREIAGAFHFETLNRGIPGLIYSVPTPEASFGSNRSIIRLGGRFEGLGGTGDWNTYAQIFNGTYENPAEQTDPNTGQIIYFSPEKYRQEGERYGIQGGIVRDFGKWRPRIGLSARFDRYMGKDLLTDRVVVGVGYGKAERRSYTGEAGLKRSFAFGLWNAAISPLLAFTTVADKGGQDFNNFLPSFAASIERQLESGHFGLHFRSGRSLTAPAFNALFASGDMFAVGNRNLKPEKGEAAEVSLRGSKSFRSGEVTLDATLFRRHTEDLIVWKRNAFSRYYPDNVDQTYARGVELTMGTVALNKAVRLNGSYIYNRSVNDTPDDINRGNITPLSPLHSGSASVSLQRRNWQIHIDGRWVGRRYSTMANFDPISTAGMGLPPYSLYDASIDRTVPVNWGEICLTAGVENLLNVPYRIVERSPMPGRTFFVRLKAEI